MPESNDICTQNKIDTSFHTIYAVINSLSYGITNIVHKKAIVATTARHGIRSCTTINSIIAQPTIENVAGVITYYYSCRVV